MLVTDMDDTLLNDDLEISYENEEAIKKAMEKGVRVVLCSGRSTTSMDKYLEQLNLKEKGQYGISCNGAVIFDTITLEPVEQESLSREYAKYLFSFAKDRGLHIQTYQNHDLIVERKNEYTDMYADITGTKPVEVGDLLSWIKEDVLKVLIQDNHEKLLEVAKELENWVKGKAHMYFSKPFYLEFTSMNANKGLFVKRLRQRLGFKKEEVICIGDSFNDLYMIEEGGLGIAVANAHPDIKKVADYVTHNDNNHHVMKEVIEKFIL